MWRERVGGWLGWGSNKEKGGKLPAGTILPPQGIVHIQGVEGQAQNRAQPSADGATALVTEGVPIPPPAPQAAHLTVQAEVKAASPGAPPHTHEGGVQQPLSHQDNRMLVQPSAPDSPAVPGRDRPPSGNYPSGGQGSGANSQMASAGDKLQNHTLEENRLPTHGLHPQDKLAEGHHPPPEGEKGDQQAPAQGGPQEAHASQAHTHEEARQDDTPLTAFVVDMGGIKPH